MKSMIIGITGYLAAGKGEVADYLVKQHGFVKRGYGDFIRAEMTRHGIFLGRDAEYAYATKMRVENGFGYWSKQIVASINQGENVVVEGIRNPLEIDELSSDVKFELWFVDAPIEVRYQRMLNRVGRTGDATTLEDFKAKEDRERASDDPLKPSINACVKRAKNVLDNSAGRDHLYHQIDQIISEIA